MQNDSVSPFAESKLCMGWCSMKGSRDMAEDKNKYILSIQGMSKSFGRNKVLNHINLNVKPGSIMGLMGENGAGKSTMMKCLFGTYQKDEGTIILDNVILNIIDTAGIRESDDVVEKIGIEKSLTIINEADLVIFILNNNEKITAEEKGLLEKLKDKKKIIVINKIDLENKLDKSILDNYIEISAKENIGIEKIKDEIKRLFNLGELEASDLTYMSNARSISLLGKSLNNINDAISEINNNSPIDIVEFHLKDAWNNLGEIIGETYTDELLDELFSRFCLGK